jgi:hypothetical protein
MEARLREAETLALIENRRAAAELEELAAIEQKMLAEQKHWQRRNSVSKLSSLICNCLRFVLRLSKMRTWRCR